MSKPKIYSFGHRWGVPEPMDVVIDVRRAFTKNPYADPALRPLRGTDHRVAEVILRTPNFDNCYAILKRDVAHHLKNGHNVALGCTGGHHRSVYLAERLAKELGVEVEHLHINTTRWPAP